MNKLNKIMSHWDLKSYEQKPLGVRPPPHPLYKLNLQRSDDPWDMYPIYQINVRDPYRVQHRMTPYGTLNTRVGTNLGR